MFHEIIVKASGNQKLHQLITSLKSRYIRQLHFKYPSKKALFQVLGKTNDEHKKILKLLKARKADELEVLLRDVHWNIVAFGRIAD
jgi:DNA-binding FadR family transcriptional regulator